MAHDVNVFASIKGNLVDKRDFTKYDDKLHKLRDLVLDMRGEKILIFTESAVTARYVHAYLEGTVGKATDVRIEEIDSQKGSGEKNSVVRRFDPKNNNASAKETENQIDMLVSTDVLSEGVNLQSGRIVINYDFHWNPVRLIQRVGRVDRIGTEHEIIEIVNFLPTSEIEQELSLRDRVASKIETIRQIIGHDQKILETTEPIDDRGVADIYDSEEDVLDGEEDGFLDTETESRERGRRDQGRQGGTLADTRNTVWHKELIRQREAPDSVRGTGGNNQRRRRYHLEAPFQEAL